MSDGTSAGTVLVTNVLDYDSTLTEANGTLFFTTSDNYTGVGVYGRELWKSDGTPAGTVRITDINPGKGDSTPSQIIGMGDAVYFNADDGTHGRELWKYDAAGHTTLVKDINPGVNNSSWDVWNSNVLTNINGTLYFGAMDGVHDYQLWKSDGTTEGTVMVCDKARAPSDVTLAGGTIYFIAHAEAGGPDYGKPTGQRRERSWSLTCLQRRVGRGCGILPTSPERFISSLMMG